MALHGCGPSSCNALLTVQLESYLAVHLFVVNRCYNDLGSCARELE